VSEAVVLIEPTPAVPPSRGGRLRAVATIAAPLAVLVAVVATGVMAGDGPEGGLGIAQRASASPAATTAVPSVDPELGDGVAISVFPVRVPGLAVRSVPEALAARRAGETGDELVAIAGYLTVRPGVERCVVRNARLAPDPLCERDTILTEGPEPVLAWDSGELRWAGIRGAAHLHPRVFPGVTLGPIEPGNATTPAAARTADGPIEPIAVVVVGRFDDPRVVDRRSSARHRGEGFAIERVAWADDEWQAYEVARLVEPTPYELDPRDVRAIALRTLPSGSTILNHALLPSPALAPVHDDAAAAILAATPDPASVWYVRAMVRTSPPTLSLADGRGPRRLGWVVIGAEGSVLASGVEG
jgi:hypothetical protein